MDPVYLILLAWAIVVSFMTLLVVGHSLMVKPVAGAVCFVNDTQMKNCPELTQAEKRERMGISELEGK